MVFFRFLTILGCFGGLEGSRRAILGPMLSDVGYKMGPRGIWIRNFVQLGRTWWPSWRQDGKINLPRWGPEGWGVKKLKKLQKSFVGRRQRRGPARGGDLKIPELDSEV